MADDDLGPLANPSTGPAAQVVAANGDDDLGPAIAQGFPKQPDTSVMKDYIQKNIAAHNAKQDQEAKSGEPDKTEAQGWFDALKAGIQTSGPGMAIHGMPTTVLPENATRAMRIASQVGQLAGDLPVMAAGGIFGDIAGGGINPVTAGAGAFAAPAALRKILTDHYEKGDIKDSSDFTDRLMSTAWEAIKGGATGAATTYTGGLAAGAGTIAKVGTELATMTTVGAGLEGHLPSYDDFVDGAILIGGLHGVGHVIPKLRNVYASTGETPADLLERSKGDVILKQDLLSTDKKLPLEAQPTDLKLTEAEKPEVKPGEVEKDPTEPPKAELVPKEPPDINPPALDKNLSDDEKEINSHIADVSESVKSIADKLSDTKDNLNTWWDKFYARNVDYLDPIKSAVAAASKLGVDVSNNSYEMARRFASHSDTVSSFLEFGTRDGEGKVNGEGLNEILKEIGNGKDISLDGFRAYGIAKRAIELDDRGIVPFDKFNRDTAERVVSNGSDKYEVFNQRRIDFENRVLSFAKDKELINDEQLKNIMDVNQNHIPMNRLMDEDAYTKNTAGGSALKKIYGSERAILDPILQTYKNTEALIRRSMINDVRTSFVDTMYEAGMIEKSNAETRNENAVLTEISPKNLPIKVSEEEATKAMREQGLIAPNQDTWINKWITKNAEDPSNPTEKEQDAAEKHYTDLFGDMPSFADAFNIWRPEKMFLKDNQIRIMEGGVARYYEGSPGVIDALKRMDGDFTAMSTWGTVMKGFAKATRLGVVLNPGFAFAHFFRSQIMSSVYSETGMKPFVNSLGAITELMGKSSKDYQDWLFHGGATGSMMRLGESYLKDNAIQSDEKTAPIHERAWNCVKTVADASEAFIKLTDNASRFSEYKRSVAAGVSPEEAAFRSREVVPDYQKLGLERSALRTSVAFIGAHINSLDRMASAFQEDPQGTVAKMSALTAVSAMLWVANKDDDAIQALPDWQKNTYWNINLSRIGGGALSGEPATILRLPKPWAPGVLFGSGAEVALDAFFKENPRSIEHFASQLGGTVIPSVIPTMLAPIKDQLENRQGFTGRPLINERMEKELPEMQYAPYTSDTAKGIAKLIGYVPIVRDFGPKTEGGTSNVSLQSPIVVENYIRAWSGTVGGWALKLSDEAINTGKKAAIMASSAPQYEKDQQLAALNVDKASPWQDTPLLHSFVSRYPSFNDQNIQDFYENKDNAERVMNSIKAASKAGDYAAAERMSQEHPDMMYRLNGIATGISTARKTYANVQDDPNIPAVEKRQLLDTMLFQVSEMAKQGNQMVSEFKKRSNATM